MTNWQTCEKYEPQPKDANIKDLPAILATIDREAKAVKSDLTSFLYRSYLNEIIGSSRQDLSTDIEQITSTPRIHLTRAYEMPTDSKSEDNTRAAILKKYDETLDKLWIAMGKADQKIKSKLVEKGFAIRNRIETKITVSVPRNLLKTKFDDEVRAAIRDGAVGNSDLWQKEGMRVAKECMIAEDDRIQTELNLLKDEIARRVKSASSHPDKLIDLFFEKFKSKIEECKSKTKYSNRHRFSGSKMKPQRCVHIDMDKMDGVLDCLKRNMETLAVNMENCAENVIELAMVLNYLLESINQ